MTERVIIDSSVFIAAALKPEGPTADFLMRWVRHQEFEVLWSQKLGYELLEKAEEMSKTVPTIIDTINRLIAFLERFATLVDDIKLDNPLPLAHDRDDDYLVALAQRYRATLISLDRRLLSGLPTSVVGQRPGERTITG